MSSPHHHPFPPSNSTTTAAPLKKKRRPAGTPDPDAEVVSLSPQTLLESDRYVCEICNQGFQRDQNLQMHRRRHKVPWKLLKREAGTVGAGEEQAVVRKRVYVCPEPSCLHHDPQHALGDLVGIKKHYRRKHSDRKQWVCERCSKGYAVQSDYKAHLKTCGTRGHTCDCGKVFSRVESFIEHQDSCFANNRSHHQNTQTSTPQTQYSLSPTASSPTPSTLTNFTSPPPPPPPLPTFFELQLLPPSTPPQPTTINSNNSPTSNCHEPYNNTIPQCLNLSLGPTNWANDRTQLTAQNAKREVELAEEEFAKAKKIRHQAQAELESAFVLKDHAAKSINSILLQLTCQSCRVKVWPTPDDVSDKDPN